ncbi:MAG: DUF3299 domain-containing protein [Granulosicoccus sp.]|nr:DUF3299 domain-containing protein [Granulosicoccus sp.]
MKAKHLIPAVVIVSLVLLLAGLAHPGWWPFSENDQKSAASAEEIFWDDLIPSDFVQPVNPFSTMSTEEIDKLLDGSEESNAELARLEAAFNYAPVVEELDGMRVKLAAYVTPLDFDGQTSMSEFLLVPYMGACIHTPPPPANQVVHAISAETIELQSAYDPIYAIGTLRTETVTSDLAESGYSLDVEMVLPYEPPEQPQ